MIKRFACTVAVIGLFTTNAPAANTLTYQFELPSTDEKLVSLNFDQAKLSVVCFLGTECPLAKLYGPRLQRISERFRQAGVEVIGVNSNVQDSMNEIRAFAKNHGIRFPMVKDHQNQVADIYGATRTSEVFLIDQFGEIRYQGRIDNQYQPGLTRSEPTRQDLVVAIEELLAGKSVSVPTTEPVGCIIGRVKSSEVSTELTYAKEISRILQRHCVECHREGEIGPFALTEYDEVVGWGEMMLEVIDEKRMPPWHANPAHGEFMNAREMPDSEVARLREWVEGGMPFGDSDDLPQPLEIVPGWQLPREPDLVLDMHTRPFQVPAEGTVEYQYFVVDPKFEEDKWVLAGEVVPGNRSVVHHCIVFIRPPDGSDFRRGFWLAGYVPGQQPVDLPEGYAVRVPAGSKLVFQMHYTPTGVSEEDMTRLGLVLADEADVTHEVFSVVGINRDFEIPPQVSDFDVNGNVAWFPPDGELIGITPHMHVRGKSFTVNVTRNGEPETILDVPNYDFNWQHFYQYQDSLDLSKIDDIQFVSTFDNSENNPVNPDPTQHVTWGDQTWEEMALAFFTVAQPRNSQVQPAYQSPVSASRTQTKSAKVDKFVKSFFERFDTDNDGEVGRSEVPIAIERFGYWKLDLNRDGTLNRDEINELAKRQLSRR